MEKRFEWREIRLNWRTQSRFAGSREEWWTRDGGRRAEMRKRFNFEEAVLDSGKSPIRAGNSVSAIQ